MSSYASPAAPGGPGSVSGAPNLPAGFRDTFTSRYVGTGDVRLHAVIGGEGPPLLVVHGWPESWYAWRMVMPALARDFEVIAVDQRGMALRQARRRVRHRDPCPADVLEYYVGALSNPESLRACFGFSRALDTTIAQDQERKTKPLAVPVLAIGGAMSFGGHVGEAMSLVADDVRSAVIADTGHFLAEESPDELLAELTPFLAPYRDAAPAQRPHAAIAS
jgi:pimeloyl-ACP methyl ester carboxylesterase